MDTRDRLISLALTDAVARVEDAAARLACVLEDVRRLLAAEHAVDPIERETEGGEGHHATLPLASSSLTGRPLSSEIRSANDSEG